MTSPFAQAVEAFTVSECLLETALEVTRKQQAIHHGHPLYDLLGRTSERLRAIAADFAAVGDDLARRQDAIDELAEATR